MRFEGCDKPFITLRMLIIISNLVLMSCSNIVQFLEASQYLSIVNGSLPIAGGFGGHSKSCGILKKANALTSSDQ